MKKILILGASILQIPAILKAKQMGLTVGVVDYDNNAVGKTFADNFFEVSTRDTNKIIEVAKEFKADGIMTLATDMPMRSVALACQELNLPSITPEVSIKATDKGEMIKAFEKNSVPHPWFYIIKTVEELYKVKNKLKFPCIIKPVDSSGSRGVNLVHSWLQLETVLESSKKISSSETVIIQEYLVGSEVSVEIFVVNNKPNIIAITDKLTTGAPAFVEVGHSQPTKLEANKISEIKEVASAAVKAIGINNGPAHVEIMYTKNGPVMIELGARLGGDNIASHLTLLSTGVNLVEATINYSCSEPFDIEIKNENASVIKYIQAEPGIISQINGIDKAMLTPGIIEIKFLKNIGEEIKRLTSSTDRIGYVISQSDNLDSANKACETALNEIEIITLPVN